MRTAGASTRRVRIVCGLGCALALIGGVLATPLHAGDTSESATGEVWSKAVADPASTPAAAAPAAEVSPAAAAPEAVVSPAPLAVASASAAMPGAPASAPSSAPSTAYSLPMSIGTTDSGALRVDPSALAAAPSNLTSTPPDQTAIPPTTEEIPSVEAAHEAAAAASQATSPSPSGDETQADRQDDSQMDLQNNPDVARYEREQSGYVDPQQYRDLRSFMAEGAFNTPIGVELEESRRRLSDGEEADGLLVLEVAKDSPAAKAGLHAYTHTARSVMTGAAIVAAMFFPPAIMAVPLLDYTQAGESYDMIIGVDGIRVTNFLDFEDRMHDLRPGEIVYLSVVRNGKREQIRVYVPRTANLTW
jgi:hypothetical protein